MPIIARVKSWYFARTFTYWISNIHSIIQYYTARFFSQRIEFFCIIESIGKLKNVSLESDTLENATNFAVKVERSGCLYWKCQILNNNIFEGECFFTFNQSTTKPYDNIFYSEICFHLEWRKIQ